MFHEHQSIQEMLIKIIYIKQFYVKLNCFKHKYLSQISLYCCMRVFSDKDSPKLQFNKKQTKKPPHSTHFNQHYLQKSPSITPSHNVSQQIFTNQKHSDSNLRYQPQEFLELNRQRYSSIINLPSHIKLDDQLEYEQKKTAKKEERNATKRQRIFQQNPFQNTKQKFIQQPEQMQTVRIGQSPKSIALRLLRQNSPINQIQHYKVNNNQRQTNPTIHKHSLQYTKKKTSEQLHESVDYLETSNRRFERQSQIESIVIAYPNLVERLETNEKQISLLRKKLNAKINNDAEKQRYFYQTQNHLANNSESYLEDIRFKRQNINYISKQLKQRQCLDMKQTIKVEDYKRQNHEITNNYANNHSSLGQQEQTEYMIIQNRIQQLRRLRGMQSQSIGNSKTVKHNSIDCSIKPQYFETHKWGNKKQEPAKMIQSVQLFNRNNNTISSHPNYKQAKFKLAQISETVPISKIY